VRSKDENAAIFAQETVETVDVNFARWVISLKRGVNESDCDRNSGVLKPAVK